MKKIIPFLISIYIPLANASLPLPSPPGPGGGIIGTMQA